MVQAGGAGWMRGSRCPTDLMDLSKEWMAVNENLCSCLCVPAHTAAILKFYLYIY